MNRLLLALLVAIVPSVVGAQSAVRELPSSNVVDVLDYGADPTGTKDSITAINTALATGKNVRVPKGKYTISAGWIDMKVPGQHLFCEVFASITVVRGNRKYAPSPALIIHTTAKDAQVSGCKIDHDGAQFLPTGPFTPLAWNNTTTGVHSSDALGSAVLIMADRAKFSGEVTRGWDVCVGLGVFDLRTGAQTPTPAPVGPVVTNTTTSYCGIGEHSFTPSYNQGAGVNVLTATGAIVADSVDRHSYGGFWVDTSGGASASFANLTAFYTRVSNTLFKGGWKNTPGGTAFYLSGANIAFDGAEWPQLRRTSCTNCTAIEPQRYAILIDVRSNGAIVTNFRGIRPGLECIMINAGQHHMTNIYCDSPNYLKGATIIRPGTAAPQTAAIQINAVNTLGLDAQFHNTNIHFDGLTIETTAAGAPRYTYALSLAAFSATPRATVRSPRVTPGTQGVYFAPPGTILSILEQ